MKSLTQTFLNEVGETLNFLNIETKYYFNPTIFLFTTLTLTVLSSFNSRIFISFYMMTLSLIILLYFNSSGIKIWIKITALVLFWTLFISIPLILSSPKIFSLFSSKNEIFYQQEGILSFILKPVTASATFTSFLLSGGGNNFIRGLESIKVPKEIVKPLSATILFIPMFTNYACRMLSAREARIVSTDVKIKWKMLSTVVGDMLLKGLEKVQTLERAIKARSFSKNYINLQKMNFKLIDLALSILTIISIILFYIFNFS